MKRQLEIIYIHEVEGLPDNFLEINDLPRKLFNSA